MRRKRHELEPIPEPAFPDASGLRSALRGLARAERRAPTEADAPKLSTLPMTPAARAALELGRAATKPATPARRRELTHGTAAAEHEHELEPDE